MCVAPGDLNFSIKSVGDSKARRGCNLAHACATKGRLSLFELFTFVLTREILAGHTSWGLFFI